MGLTKFNEDTNNIQGLADKPTQSASELKALFDKIGSDIKAYINGTLTTEIDSALARKANSNNVYTKNEVYSKIDTDNLLENKAPNNHASNSAIYGVSNDTTYGHCKVLNQIDVDTYTEGEALSAYQGYYLKTLIDSKQKNISSGTSTPSGGSNGDIYIQYF